MPIFRYNNKQEVFYELYGEEGDPVLTIINGLSMRTTQWAPYFKLLPAAGVRVLTYDMLGQGRSSKPILGVDFDDHAHILKALHDHLGIGKPYVLGISFGGVVALKYAVLFPDALKGLIPVSTFSELDPQLSGHACNLFVGMARVGFEFYLDLLMPLNFSNHWLRSNQPGIEVIKRLGASSNELFGIQNLMESLQGFQSMTPELKRIKAPALILNGEYDVLTPRHLHDIIRREVKNSRLMIVPHMCHAFTLEVPELTSRLLVDFIRAVERGDWKGDQSVWVANEDLAAPQIGFPYPAVDHLRFVPTGSPIAPPPAVDAVVAETERPKAAGKKPKAKSPVASKPAKPAAVKPTTGQAAAKTAPSKKAKPARGNK